MARAAITVTMQDHLHARRYLELMPGVHHLSIDDVVERIVTLNEGLRRFWSSAQGWASIEAAHLLSKSRLDRQVLLSSTLKLWTSQPDIDEGRLVLAWANLGSLVEGSMKLFLSVYYESYKSSVSELGRKHRKDEPDGLQLEPLRQHFLNQIWGESFDIWIQKIQKRRNAIHAYQDRDLGTYEEFVDCLKEYLVILRYINYRLPYPDVEYIPTESSEIKNIVITEAIYNDIPIDDESLP